MNAALAATADLNDPADVRAVVAQVNAELKAEVLAARPAGATRAEVASDQAVPAGALAEYRAGALWLLARSPQAEAEAETVRAAEQRRAHRHPTQASAQEGAERVADTARRRTAEHLLQQRLRTVQQLRQHTQRPATAPAREAVNT
ncbi:hypothetical protein [Kitasatospora sp. NPDC002040]|uniref:hypothetical protein n=1 Tax=Kitasatospora sp. NPDC002040 TaxID=3154661 RepID=UPI003325881D